MLRRFAGWLYVLGAAAVIGGGITYVHNIPNVPSKSDLVKVSGFLVAVQLKKDFDGTDIVYLRYRDNPQPYEYLSGYPLYIAVRDRLGIYRTVDVWVDKHAKKNPNRAIPVWGLVEHNPYKPGIVVTYDQIVKTMTRANRSWQRIARFLIIGGLAAIALGFGIRKAVPYKPEDPSF